MVCTTEENKLQISVWIRGADGFTHEMKHDVWSKVVIHDLKYTFFSIFLKLIAFFVQHINLCIGIIYSWTATKIRSLKKHTKTSVEPHARKYRKKTIQNSIAKPSPFWRFYKRFIWCLCALKAVWKCKQTMLNDRF